MASTITNKADKTKLVDQMLEDLAGEEFDDFAENDMYASKLSRFVEDEPFADIDGFH